VKIQGDIKMSISVDDIEVHDYSCLSENHQAVLDYTLGERDCYDSVYYQAGEYFLFAFLVALFVFFLFLPCVDDWLSYSIASSYYRLFFKVLLVFIFVFIFDRLVKSWRDDHEVCEVLQ